MTGKLTRETLERLVLSRTGAASDAVLVGPAVGEDAAAMRGDDRTLVASTDPISLAADRIGRLAVAVSTNDVAACGAVPEFLLATILLPDPDADRLDAITADLDAEADRLGVTVVGGHTEVVAGLDRPLLSLACLGYTDRYVPTGGAADGDRLLLTKAAATEATAVLATDFRETLAGSVPAAAFDRGVALFDEVSVLREATALASLATAMHDPTEGGVLAGAVEMALTADRSLRLDREAVPVRETTRRLCRAAGIDPLRSLGSGSLLAAVAPADVDRALDALDDAGVPGAVVGTFEDGPAGVHVDGEFHDEPVRDDTYALWD